MNDPLHYSRGAVFLKEIQLAKAGVFPIGIKFNRLGFTDGYSGVPTFFERSIHSTSEDLLVNIHFMDNRPPVKNVPWACFPKDPVLLWKAVFGGQLLPMKCNSRGEYAADSLTALNEMSKDLSLMNERKLVGEMKQMLKTPSGVEDEHRLLNKMDFHEKLKKKVQPRGLEAIGGSSYGYGGGLPPNYSSDE